MTQWTPIWKVEIDGVEYTSAILANLTIRSGRTNIYEQAQAGYVNIQLLDVDQSAIPSCNQFNARRFSPGHVGHLCPHFWRERGRYWFGSP
jgi:hypothetical protein